MEFQKRILSQETDWRRIFEFCLGVFCPVTVSTIANVLSFVLGLLLSELQGGICGRFERVILYSV